MTITFGGLATGLDTGEIISALMEVERAPLSRLETEKEYLASRLAAFSTFETNLNNFSSAIDELNTEEELTSNSVRSGSEEYFSVTMENSLLATHGNFQLEVTNLAQVQKDVSVGYSERDTAVFSGGTITLNATTDITINDNSSLNDIKAAINDANETLDTGITASIIHDGTDYRIVLTGKDAGTSFTAASSGISDGTTTLSFVNTQVAEQAEITIDGIAITSNSNTIDNAIPGVSIDLLKENTSGETTIVTVESDFTEISSKLDGFVSAYNDITNFINDQDDADWSHDSNFRNVTSKLQNLLVSDPGSGTGTFNYLVDIGFETDSATGLISIDSSKLTETLEEDFESVQQLLIGDGSNQGILAQFDTYLDQWTDSSDGIYAAKKNSYDSSVKSLDASILRMESRLEQRENTLLAQFSAMETLVNSLNSTSSYLTQQMDNMPSFGGS